MFVPDPLGAFLVVLHEWFEGRHDDIARDRGPVTVVSGAFLNVGCKHFNKVVYSHFGLQADRSLFDLGYFNPVANFV